MKRGCCLYLIGFMGAGKSSIGIRLAERLSYRFIDTDTVIEKEEGMSIDELFTRKGEQFFRLTEKEVLRELTEKYKREGFVMSTGGGMPCTGENLRYMKQNGTVIYLRSSIEDIIERVGESKTRPLILGLGRRGSLREGLEALLSRRERYYRRADITVQNSRDDDLDQIVQCIEKKLDD